MGRGAALFNNRAVAAATGAKKTAFLHYSCRQINLNCDLCDFYDECDCHINHKNHSSKTILMDEQDFGKIS